MSDDNKMILVGQIGGAFGVKGEVRITAFTADPMALASYKTLMRQDGSPALLLSPDYWIGRIGEAGLLRPGTVVMSGTIPMLPGVDQFADAWRVELAAPDGTVSRVAYAVEELPPAWE